MFLASLALTTYRNYKSLFCEFCPGINLVTGANAQGKTNLIEAVYYLSIGRAYRQVRDEQLIKWGEDSFQIVGNIESRQGKTEIETRFAREGNPAKTVLVGGLRVTKREDVSGRFTSVLFSPESMSIIKGSPQERRDFLNYDIGQISLTYTSDLYRYRRLLAQRNALLKKLGPITMSNDEKAEKLSVWDQQLIIYGSRIVDKRIAVIDKITPLVRLIHRKLANSEENMEVRYVLSAKGAPPLRQDKVKTPDAAGFLREARERLLGDDLRLGSTQWGPHRDDLKITLGGVDMRQYGSQGQQRTGVLALKLAELEIFRGESGEYPLLLLDDVMSELDEERQMKLLNFIHEKNIQSIITATEAKNMYLIEKRQSRRFFVNRGEIETL
jgi:DNA replication and repair protein RecF